MCSELLKLRSHVYQLNVAYHHAPAAVSLKPQFVHDLLFVFAFCCSFSIFLIKMSNWLSAATNSGLVLSYVLPSLAITPNLDYLYKSFSDNL